MPKRIQFKAFFSYAHLDARADPKLVEAVTTTLEGRVGVRLANDSFEIWRDTEDLRLGERWNDKIEQAIRASDVLIVLLTPKWIGSDFCRKEYRTFEKVEPGLGDGEFVAPLLVRPLANQESHFTDEQREVWARLKDRQFKPLHAVDFLRLAEDERTALIDKLAEEIEAMLDRRRQKLLRDNAAGTAGSPAPAALAEIQQELSQANREAERRHRELLAVISAEKGVSREKLEPILAALGHENVPLEEMPQRLREAVDALRAKAAEPVRASNEGIEVDQAIRDARAELSNLNTEAAIAVLDNAMEADEAFKAAAQRRATLLVEKADIQRRSFDHSGAIASLEEAVRLDRDRIWAWIALGNARRIADSLAGARTAFGNALDAANRVGGERETSVVLAYMGDVLLAEGDRSGALDACRRSLDGFESLAAKDPGNTQWQRDLSISRSKVNAILDAKGDRSSTRGKTSARRRRRSAGPS